MAPLIRAGLRLATAGLLVSALALPVRAGHDQTPTEWQVKAAFLFNFVGFVEWPEGSVPEDHFVIGVLGPDPFGETLDALVEGERRAGRPLVARRYDDVEEAAEAQVLYVALESEAAVARALRRLEGQPILTVGESRDFIDDGGMVRFVVESNRVRFEIDEGRARAAGLQVSSHLLRLAVEVRDTEQAGAREPER